MWEENFRLAIIIGDDGRRRADVSVGTPWHKYHADTRFQSHEDHAVATARNPGRKQIPDAPWLASIPCPCPPFQDKKKEREKEQKEKYILRFRNVISQLDATLSESVILYIRSFDNCQIDLIFEFRVIYKLCGDKLLPYDSTKYSTTPVFCSNFVLVLWVKRDDECCLECVEDSKYMVYCLPCANNITLTTRTLGVELLCQILRSEKTYFCLFWLEEIVIVVFYRETTTKHTVALVLMI